MVQELTEDHQLWEQEMAAAWTPDFDLTPALPRWERRARTVAWVATVLIFVASQCQLLL